jgi:hypothetical protein
MEDKLAQVRTQTYDPRSAGGVGKAGCATDPPVDDELAFAVVMYSTSSQSIPL